MIQILLIGTRIKDMKNIKIIHVAKTINSANASVKGFEKALQILSVACGRSFKDVNEAIEHAFRPSVDNTKELVIQLNRLGGVLDTKLELTKTNKVVKPYYRQNERW